MLYIFAGLPGTGKTTLARQLAQHRRAVYLRIDTLEQALRREGVDVVAHGYRGAMALAADNLEIGLPVVVDSVNPWPSTRREYRAVAQAVGCPYVDIEVVCSDEAEHRRRVEQRVIDIAGHARVTWQQVRERDYRPWDEAPVRVDTAGKTVGQSLRELLRLVP